MQYRTGTYILAFMEEAGASHDKENARQATSVLRTQRAVWTGGQSDVETAKVKLSWLFWETVCDRSGRGDGWAVERAVPAL